jgi:hypothetical protein
MRVRVDVTQRDFKIGKPLEPTRCPIARAVNRVLRKPFLAVVFPGWIEIREPSTPQRMVAKLRMPAIAQRIVAQVDCVCDHGITEAAFTLNIPKEHLKCV